MLANTTLDNGYNLKVSAPGLPQHGGAARLEPERVCGHDRVRPGGVATRAAQSEAAGFVADPTLRRRAFRWGGIL